MEEIWKDINGYDGLYQASNFGRIRSFYYRGLKRKVPKILKPQKSHYGYYNVFLYKEGKHKLKRVNRLVYEAFIGEIPEGYQVNHINEIKTDNRLDNLNLMTPKENTNWGTGIERMAKNRSKSVIQKTLEGEVIKIWLSATEIQRQLGYGQGNICDCCNGKGKTAYGYIWEYYTEKATA